MSWACIEKRMYVVYGHVFHRHFLIIPVLQGSIDLSQFKIVYIAPMKALVQECVANFTKVRASNHYTGSFSRVFPLSASANHLGCKFGS